jgi:hypothetical protein
MTRKTRQNDAETAQEVPYKHVLSTKTRKKVRFWAI